MVLLLSVIKNKRAVYSPNWVEGGVRRSGL